MDNYKCCFTGLRPQKLSFIEHSDEYKLVMSRFEIIIKKLINKYNINYFISGMALGWDTWCAKLILELQNDYPAIILECALPCNNQDKYWNTQDKATYRKILSGSQIITYTQKVYSSDCMMKRNRYMIDSCDYVVGLWDGQPGGTASTIKYAISQNKKIIVINPDNLEVRIKF